MKVTEEFLSERPNLDYVAELIGTKDFDFEHKFVTLLKSEFSWDLGQYLYHMRKDEPRAAAEIVHKLKYKFSVLGMEKTFLFAERHKEKLHIGDKALEADFKKVLTNVSSFLETV